MSAQSEGIIVRHSKLCRSHNGGKCSCAPTFQANVWDGHTGRRHFKTFKRKPEAKSWRVDMARAISSGTLTKPTKTTIASAGDDLIAGMRDGSILDRSGATYKPSTVRSYEQALRSYVTPKLGRYKLSEARRRDVQDMVDRWRKDGLSPATIANKLDPLRVIYRRALYRDEVTTDPTKGLQLPARRGRRDRIETPERAAELLEALPDTERALWTTMLYAGLRVGEARALRWQHVDFDRGVLHVDHGWDDMEGEQDVKSDAGRRVVPLAGRLRSELVRHKLATGRKEDELVFGRTPTAPFVRSTIRARARRAWSGPGLEPLTPHEARHCAASYLIAAGVNVKELSVYIGHSDIRTTFNRYGHLLPGGEVEAVAKLDALLDRPAQQGRNNDHLTPAVLSPPSAV